METLLKRKDGLNIYYLNNKIVDRVKIYNENGVIFSFLWLEGQIITNNVTKEVKLPFEVKAANKINYNRKDAFFCKEGEYKNLFIHADQIEYSKGDDYVKNYSDEDLHYNTFKVKFNTIDINENEYSEKLYSVKTLYKRVKTEKCIEIENLQDKFKDMNININFHTLEKILNVAEIKFK